MNGLGGCEAEIRYDAGDSVNYYSIYLSGTPKVINIASASNVNRRGVWEFRLDLEKDQEEHVVPDQVEESMAPDYKGWPLVTCCDQSEYLHGIFQQSWLLIIFTPQSGFKNEVLLNLS